MCVDAYCTDDLPGLLKNRGDRPFGCTDYPYEIVKVSVAVIYTPPHWRYEGLSRARDLVDIARDASHEGHSPD